MLGKYRFYDGLKEPRTTMTSEKPKLVQIAVASFSSADDPSVDMYGLDQYGRVWWFVNWSKWELLSEGIPQDEPKEEQRTKMRKGSVRAALRRQDMDDSETRSGIDQIDLVTGKIRGS